MKTLFACIFVLAFSGCATDPSTGRQYWDAPTTFRAIGAAVGVLQGTEAQPAP